MQTMMCLTAVRHRRAHWQMTRMLVDQALFGTASRDKTSEDDVAGCVWGRGGARLCARQRGVCELTLIICEYPITQSARCSNCYVTLPHHCAHRKEMVQINTTQNG
jgi:hypothetical protein